MRILTPILVAFLLSQAVAGLENPVAFCDLVRSPERFNGKEVTVRATYHYGFEWRQLYCLDCLDKGPAWLEIPYDLDDASEKALKRLPEGAGIVNITVQGTFMGRGSYGHLGGYHYQLVAKKITNVAVIVKGMKPIAEEEAAEKKWACRGTNPK